MYFWGKILRMWHSLMGIILLKSHPVNLEVKLQSKVIQQIQTEPHFEIINYKMAILNCLWIKLEYFVLSYRIPWTVLHLSCLMELADRVSQCQNNSARSFIWPRLFCVMDSTACSLFLWEKNGWGSYVMIERNNGCFSE